MIEAELFELLCDFRRTETVQCELFRPTISNFEPLCRSAMFFITRSFRPFSRYHDIFGGLPTYFT